MAEDMNYSQVEKPARATRNYSLASKQYKREKGGGGLEKTAIPHEQTHESVEEETDGKAR